MNCNGLEALPSLTLQPSLPPQCPSLLPSSDNAVMVQELVVQDSNIANLWKMKLHDEYHMSSLRRMALTECMMQAIEDDSFYEMSHLQNLNLRYEAIEQPNFQIPTKN